MEEDLKVTIGKQYKNSQGDKVQIMCADDDDQPPFNGYVFSNGGPGFVESNSSSGLGFACPNLNEEWTDPKISERWHNVYNSGMSAGCLDRKTADLHEYDKGKIALLHVTYNHDTKTPSVKVIK